MLKKSNNWLLLFGMYLSFTTVSAQKRGTDSSAVCKEQGLCCDNDPTPAGVMISHAHAKNEWMASYRYMNMAMSGVMKGDGIISGSEVLQQYNATPKEMRMNMHMFMLMYGITDRLTVMGMLHYNSTWMKMNMKMGAGFHSHTMKTSGIGDVKLNAIYALLKQHHRQLLLSLGSSLPMGSTNFKGKAGSMMYPEQRYPYNMQAGTGTMDVSGNLCYLARRGNFYYSIQAQATVRTTNNAIGYRYGNEYGVIAWTAYHWLPVLSSSLRLEAVLSDRIHGSDPMLDPTLEIAANPANYGGRRLNTYVGFVFQSDRQFLTSSKFCLEFGLPVYQYYNGYQMRADYNLLLTYNLSF